MIVVISGSITKSASSRKSLSKHNSVEILNETIESAFPLFAYFGVTFDFRIHVLLKVIYVVLVEAHVQNWPQFRLWIVNGSKL